MRKAGVGGRYFASVLVLGVMFACTQNDDDGGVGALDALPPGVQADGGVEMMGDAEEPDDPDSGLRGDVDENPDPDAGPMDAEEPDNPDTGPMDAEPPDDPDAGEEIQPDAEPQQDAEPPDDPDAGPELADLTFNILLAGEQGDTPYAGAVVVVMDISGNELTRGTANGQGMVTVMNLPAETELIAHVLPMGQNTGAAAGVTAPDEEAVEISVQSTARITELLMEGNITYNSANGVVGISVETPSMAGGEGVTLSLASGGSLVINGQGDLVAGNTLLPNAPDQLILFGNVTPGPLTVMPVSPAGRTCVPSPEILAVFANTVTDIALECQ